MKTVKLKNGFMNSGKIKISKSGEIILQFENYHHVIDGDTELCYADQVEQKIKELESKIEKLKQNTTWNLQSEKDIFFEIGKSWSSYYAVIFKDGTFRLASGGCDEGCDGSVSSFLYFLGNDMDIDEDFEWEYDDIEQWMEIQRPIKIQKKKMKSKEYELDMRERELTEEK